MTESTNGVVIRIPCSDGAGSCTKTGPFKLPLWIAAVHILSNVALWVLNVYWFGKMTSLLRRRITGWFAAKTETKEK